LNSISQKAGDQVWEIVNVMIRYGVESTFDPRKFRCVKHQKPQVSYWYSANEALEGRFSHD
jgi:hypothetical protein